jgi:hypothetical protein
MNTRQTELTAASVATSLSGTRQDAVSVTPAVSMGRQYPTSGYAARGLVQHFAMPFGNQHFASSVALPRP